MEMIDILNKLREYEKAGHSVGDAIKGAEMTQPLAVSKADKMLNTPAYQKMKDGDPKYADKTDEGGMSDIHIGAQDVLDSYTNEDGDLKMPKADVMKAMATEKEKAAFPRSYEIETAMKMADEHFNDDGSQKIPHEVDVAMNMDSEQPVEQPVEEKAKPDFLDMDKDGNKTEPMKKAIKDKEMKKETVKEAIQMSADTPEEAGVLMQILKLAGVQPVDAKMIGAEQPAEMPADETELANSPAGYTNDQKVQSIDDLVNVHSGGLNRQKVQIKKGHPGDNELTAEDLANSLRTQYESFKEQYAKAVTEAKKKD